MVKKIKHLFKGAKNEDELANAFLAMNQTPIAAGRPSPAEIHFGRNLRDELHVRVEQSCADWTDVTAWKKAKQSIAKEIYDRGTRELSELHEKERVLVWHNEKWERAVVRKKVAERPRSYELQLDLGRRIERNRIKIRRVEKEERPKNEKTVSPILHFQQALPPLGKAPPTRRGIWIVPPEDDPSPPLDQDLPPMINAENDPENTNEPPARLSAPPAGDSGPSPSTPAAPKSPPRTAKSKAGSSKKTTAKNRDRPLPPVPEATEEPPTTKAGRPVIAPDRWIYHI
jgi:hypothetical protein